MAFSRATGLPVRTIGSPGSGPGQLQNPSALTIDGGGTIVVADSGNERIARFSTGGSYLGATTGVGDGRGIAVTPDGQRTYVSTANHRIEVFDPSGSEVDEFGGQGSKLGKLESPGQITLDAAGNLWVADRGNNRIQEFGPAGERLLAFGQRGAALGEFVHPTGREHRLPRPAHGHRQRQQPRAAVRPGRAGGRAVRRPDPGRQPAGAQAPDAARAAGPAGDAARPAQHRPRGDAQPAAARRLRHHLHGHRHRHRHPEGRARRASTAG